VVYDLACRLPDEQSTDRAPGRRAHRARPRGIRADAAVDGAAVARSDMGTTASRTLGWLASSWATSRYRWTRVRPATRRSKWPCTRIRAWTTSRSTRH